MGGETPDEIIILMVDDDPEDVFLTEHAFRKGKLANNFRSVSNGRQLLDYLRNEGEYTDMVAHPRPHIVLLDINMPIMNGFEALTEVRRDPRISDIPIVIMTTSREHVDISRGYASGGQFLYLQAGDATGHDGSRRSDRGLLVQDRADPESETVLTQRQARSGHCVANSSGESFRLRPFHLW